MTARTAGADHPLYICICNAVNDKAISAAIVDGAATVEQVFAALDIAEKCGTCKSSIDNMIQATLDEREGRRSSDPAITSKRRYSLAAE